MFKPVLFFVSIPLLLLASAAAEATTDGEIMPGEHVNMNKHNKILREKMAALANEHPELLAALKNRLEVSRKFERERAKKFD